MNDLIDSVVKRISFDIKEKNVEMIIQKEMPTIICDRIKIGEVFLNLINNGIKFSSKNNNRNPKIEVGYEESQEFHKFWVKDNDIGIEEQYQEKIFGLFKRLHKASEYSGTGAGLSIVKKVIDDHGGKIWVKSKINEGAIFYFTIPKSLKINEGEDNV